MKKRNKTQRKKITKTKFSKRKPIVKGKELVGKKRR